MPSVSVNPPKTPVTKGSNGVAVATVPNVCKMPGPPAPFVPTPLPNIARSGTKPKGYTKDVKIEKKTVAVKGASFESQGDMASKGTGGGVVSANTHGPAKFVGPGSLDVKAEGKNIQLLGDPMLNNCGPSGSPPNAATLAGLVQGIAVVYKLGPGDPNCPHPNTERSDPAKGEKKKRELERTRQQEEVKMARLFRRALKLENAGNLKQAMSLLDSAIDAEGQANGKAWEQKVAADTNAQEQSVDYYCPDCGRKGEFDCITDTGIIKEAKASGKAVSYGQIKKHISVAAILFPGAPVHAAVPAGEARNVVKSIPRSSIQEH